MTNLLSFGDVHRLRPEPPEGEMVERLFYQPVVPHPYLDIEAVKRGAALIPAEIRIGQEIYVGNFDEYAASPWQLVVGMAAATCKVKGNLVSIDYEPMVVLLDRAAYGYFLSGDYAKAEFVSANISEVSAARLSAMWQEASELICANDNGSPAREFIQPCPLVRFPKGVGRLLKRLGNPIGQHMKIVERGDTPVLITGIGMSGYWQVNDQAPDWKVHVQAHFLQPGYPQDFMATVDKLQPASIVDTPRFAAAQQEPQGVNLS